MNNRLQQFLSAENMSQAQFADIIGVARASVSHIIAGRNKPGFDFIEGMISHFPNLNIEWLITGKGRMYTNQAGLFPAYEPETPVKSIQAESPEIPEPEVAKAGSDASIKVTDIPVGQRNISKIIIFFDDNTFKELK